MHQVHFAGPARAREAFRSGRLLLVPSRAESLPYMVLEAIGARVPILTTSVGGIPEVFGPDAGELLPPGDVGALVAAIERMRGDPDWELVDRLRARVEKFFSVKTMTDGVLAAYADAGARKRAVSD
jgi:glycosyltransferase involved in cell wall biosynthesis